MGDGASSEGPPQVFSGREAHVLETTEVTRTPGFQEGAPDSEDP